MGREGSRSGAGRKPALEPFEAIWVAARVARYRRAVTRARLNAARRDYFSRSDIRDTHKALRSVPVFERRAFLETYEGEELLDKGEFARREMAGIDAYDERDGPRIVSFSVSRLYALEDRIIGKVARRASVKFAKKVTPRSVKRAWKLWSAVEAEKD